VSLALFNVLQDFVKLLADGHRSLDKRLHDVVEQSVGDLEPYVLSMSLDAATVMYGCSEAQALRLGGHAPIGNTGSYALGLGTAATPLAGQAGWGETVGA
jgi:hypothetical protein